MYSDYRNNPSLFEKIGNSDEYNALNTPSPHYL